ncbi:MAG: pyrimidine operon regulatory protein/uracil phosphoribosyltransferase [Actinomycetota bacterium]
MASQSFDRETGPAPSTGSVCVLPAEQVRRAIKRIAHEILENIAGGGRVPFVLMGLQRGGVWIADQLRDEIRAIDAAAEVDCGAVDVSMYRDDLGLRPTVPASASIVPRSLDGVEVILVDDVLYTGRTVRAALDALIEYGRPRAVRLAVLVDRGHRELPIRPDFVGKNLPTHSSDEVSVLPEGVFVANGVHK